MPRFARYGETEVPRMGGDVGFVGVMDVGSPEAIADGFVQRADNVTFRNRRGRTRGGSRLPTSFRHADLTGPLFGCGIFSDPSEKEWVLQAVAGEVWQFRDGHTPRRIGIPAPLTKRCAIVQGFDEVLLFRGDDLVPWRWGGSFGEPFVEVDQTDQGNNTRPIPNGPDLVTRPGLSPRVINSRVIVPHGRNSVAFSDIENYVRYDAAFAAFNLSASNDDTLTGLLPVGQNGLLVGKDQSMAVLSGIDRNLAVALQPVNGAIGCVAGGTMANLGGDALFLSSNGVYSVAAVLENRLEAAPVALSRPVEKLFERVNWSRIAGAVAVVFGEEYLLAVPIDGATRNNAILAYNTQAKAWQGVHEFPESGPDGQWAWDALLVTDYLGEKRLLGIDFESARTHLLYEGRQDMRDGLLRGSGPHGPVVTVAGLYAEIESRVRLRGYGFDAVGRKAVHHGKLHVAGWYPQVTVAIATDGVNTDQTALTWAPVRTRYKIFGVPDYVETNVNDDHGAPGREDYSVDPAVDGTVIDAPMTLTGLMWTGEVVGTIIYGTFFKNTGSALTIQLYRDEARTQVLSETSLEESPNAVNIAFTGVVGWGGVTGFEGRIGNLDAMPNLVETDFEITRTVSGVGFDPEDTGIDFDLEQTHQLPVAARVRGRFIQLEITNARGTLELAAAEVEGVKTERKDMIA